jgi:hypothetical protein
LRSAKDEFQSAAASHSKRLELWEKKHGAAHQAYFDMQMQPSQAMGTQGACVHIFRLKMGLTNMTAGTQKNKNIRKPIDLPKAPELHMQPGEDLLFLNLGTAMKIYTQYEISHNDVQHAQSLIRKYLLDFKEVSPLCVAI